jgi:hypothetical protein
VCGASPGIDLTDERELQAIRDRIPRTSL